MLKLLLITLMILLLCSCANTQTTDYDKVLDGHTATVLSLDNNKNGKYLCSGSYDSEIILWDYKTGKQIKKFSGHSGGIWNVKISPDDKFLAFGSWDNNINANGSSIDCLSLVDLETLVEIGSFSIEPDRFENLGFIPELDDSTSNGVYKIAFSPNSKRLAVISNRGDLFIWDLDNGFMRSEYMLGDTHHKLIDLSPDWKYLVCTERERRLVDTSFYFLSFDKDEIVSSFDTPGKTMIDVIFSNDLKTIASIGGNRILRNEIYLWDTKTQKLLNTLNGHKNVIRSIDFSSDDKYLASAGEDNLINLWDVRTGELIATFTENNGKELTSVLFSYDDKYLITGSQDKTIKYWKINNWIYN